MIEQLQTDIERAYDDRPVIVVHDINQYEELEIQLKKNKWRYMSGTDVGVLATIRHWSYGILLLQSKDGRGVDARFQKDALVLIIAKVNCHNELQ